MNILVTGGTGKTGRRVAQRLFDLGHDVRVGSRSAAAPFDWTDPGTFAAALRGAGAVYIAYQPDLASPGAAETVEHFTRLAAAAGVGRAVLLSGRGEAEAEASERGFVTAATKGGLKWTVLRCAWFHQNFDEGHFREPLAAGVFAVPAGSAPEPFVDAGDIADVAVAALTGDEHHEKVYELTGPRLLTFAEAVAVLGVAAGREIAFAELPVEQYAAALTADGVPAETIDLMVYLFTTVLDGRNAHLSDDVHRVLGRTPRDLAAYAHEHAGAWRQR
ncbi:uncharacterized protein YbjT (DUF2867 family) [Micromonospora sp. A200]|uniref:NAD(P)H-binding protein n=1 Tax=Micromonospora sp. A200 TaxID=2940568 RepID=UPI002472F338|nr:NAD(P)H-binding protein [Micromonospora sp. A200]MDH6466384.1 uncharacterized protein YbjT (DUF2867 family) [Micromonospora sp. A200]